MINIERKIYHKRVKFSAESSFLFFLGLHVLPLGDKNMLNAVRPRWLRSVAQRVAQLPEWDARAAPNQVLLNEYERVWCQCTRILAGTPVASAQSTRRTAIHGIGRHRRQRMRSQTNAIQSCMLADFSDQSEPRWASEAKHLLSWHLSWALHACMCWLQPSRRLSKLIEYCPHQTLHQTHPLSCVHGFWIRDVQKPPIPGGCDRSPSRGAL